MCRFQKKFCALPALSASAISHEPINFVGLRLRCGLTPSVIRTRGERLMAYSEKVVDHYNNPRNVGSLPKEDPNVGTGLVGAPECGDVMKLQMRINPETQVIEEARF